MLAIVPAVRAAGAFVMVRDGLPMCFIVLREDAAPAEKYAARELTTHLKQITGAGIPVRVMKYDDIPETGRAVLLGHGDWLKKPRFRDSLEDMNILGGQSLVIKSYGGSKPEVLILSGKTPRGTLYAVYELLRKIGVRWYTKDVTGFPGNKTIDLGEIEISDLPCFDFREVSIPEADVSPEWRARLRLSAGFGFMEKELACLPVFYPLEVHSDSLIPAVLFEEFPGLFPLINGERTPVRTCRCFSDPHCATLASDSIIAYLSDNQNVTCITFYFQDYVYSCKCGECARIREREKSESGLVLRWVNSIAERVNREFPGVLFEMNAAGILEKPPEVTVPADNVIIRLCPYGVDQLRLYEDSIDERTMEFMEHFLGWRRLNARVDVSHPCGHKDFPLVSFPDFRQIFKNIEMYHYNFVEGCFFNCAPEQDIFFADAELRMWVLSELMWDRYRDGETLVKEWMRGVYRNARGPMMDYWKHVQNIALTPNTKITSHTEPREYLSADWLDEAARMFQRAYALSLTDSTAHRYIRKARLGFRYMQFLHLLSACSSKPQLNKQQKEKYLDMLEEWVTDYREFGYERVTATESCEEFADRIREDLK
jgi:hypothetical protein